MEISGFEPEASRMQSERSTTELYPHLEDVGCEEVKKKRKWRYRVRTGGLSHAKEESSAMYLASYRGPIRRMRLINGGVGHVKSMWICA